MALNLFSRYRFPEIIQIFGISFSLIFFLTDFPENKILFLWAASLFTAIASAFWLNDFFDFQDDQINPRKIRHESRTLLLILALGALTASLISGFFVSTGLFLTALTIGISSALYSVPFIRLKSRIFIPLILHFFMGVVFFQSAAHLGEFNWNNEVILMGIFWGLILSSGSLGNELVDHEVDKRMMIRTIANSYPLKAKMMIMIIQALALLILVLNMIHLGLSVSLLFSGLVGMTVIFLQLKNTQEIQAGQFRKLYRLIFAAIIVVFHLELALRG